MGQSEKQKTCVSPFVLGCGQSQWHGYRYWVVELRKVLVHRVRVLEADVREVAVGVQNWHSIVCSVEHSMDVESGGVVCVSADDLL